MAGKNRYHISLDRCYFNIGKKEDQELYYRSMLKNPYLFTCA